MSGVAHLHRKVVGSLSVGSLPTYLLFVFGLGGCLLILSGGSTFYCEIYMFYLNYLYLL